MAFDVHQYTVNFEFTERGATPPNEQIAKVVLYGKSSGEMVTMEFSSDVSAGRGTVSVTRPDSAICRSPRSQFDGFLEGLKLLLENDGASVAVSQNPPAVYLNSKHIKA